MRGREAEKLPTEKKIDCITVSFAPVKATIDDQMQRLADALVSSIKKGVLRYIKHMMPLFCFAIEETFSLSHTKAVEEYVTTAVEKLNKPPQTMDEITQATQDYKSLLEEKPLMRAAFDQVDNKNQLFYSY